MESEHLTQLKKALNSSWSLKSSSKWSTHLPATGQCGVTALVIHDLLGGEIKKTKLPQGWHFYNVIDGKRHDFTASQFKDDIEYQDVSSNREEAYSDTSETQYNYLKQAVIHYLNT